MNLILRKLSASDEAAFIRANQAFANESFVFALDYSKDKNFGEYLERLEQNYNGLNLEPGWVPNSLLFGFDDEQIIGRVSIRHKLNPHLEKVGGHVGYGIVPEFRLRGYASKLLKLSLPKAKELGLSKVLLTCDDDNIGSIRTIEKNGGILENKISIGEPPQLKRRYWISL